MQTIAGLCAIKAKTFVDATGDAYLARSAGAHYECGYEKTGNNQPLSFRFEMGGIDIDRLYRHVAIELNEDWCKSKPPYFEIAEAMHRKQRYKLEELMAQGVASGELTQEEAEYMQGYTFFPSKSSLFGCCRIEGGEIQTGICLKNGLLFGGAG